MLPPVDPEERERGRLRTVRAGTRALMNGRGLSERDFGEVWGYANSRREVQGANRLLLWQWDRVCWLVEKSREEGIPPQMLLKEHVDAAVQLGADATPFAWQTCAINAIKKTQRSAHNLEVRRDVPVQAARQSEAPLAEGQLPLPVSLTSLYMPSVLDQTIGHHYVRRLFIFRFPQAEDVNATIAASTYLRRGLKLTLAEYPVLTGYLGPATNTAQKNMVKIRIKNNQVLGAHVTETIFVIKVVKESEEPELARLPSFEALLHKRMPSGSLPTDFYCATPACTPSMPAFTLQATFLREGKGLVLGFNFQNTLIDGTAMATVFDTFVENLKLASTHDMGKFPDAVLPYQNLSIAAYLSADVPATEPPTPTLHTKSTSYTISSPILIFDSKQIEGLKELLNLMVSQPAQSERKLLTKTDCISGLIWVAVACARRDAAEPGPPAQQLTHFFRTAVNTRAKLSPPLPPKYFGNMFAHAITHSTQGALPSPNDNPALDTAAFLYAAASHAVKVRRAIEGVTDKSMRERLSRAAMLEDVKQMDSPFDGARGLDFGSLALFGADLEFDIPGAGSSCAEFCRTAMPGKEGVANVLPRRGGTQGNAAWEVVVSLRTEQAEMMVDGLKRMKLVTSVATM